MTVELTEKQKAYYDDRVEFISSMGVAVPYNMILEKALSMTDKEIDDFLEPKYLYPTTNP